VLPPDFDRGLPTENPITARMAVDRGHQVVTQPVLGIMAGVFLLGAVLGVGFGQLIAGLALIIRAPYLAWLWWSYATPRWRRWALGRGAHPDFLQELAQREWLVWPRGHLFERTEFRERGDE